MKFIRQFLAVLAGAFLFLSIVPLAVAEATPWVSSGNLAKSRSDHTATLLPDGRILVCGGSNVDAGRTASAELYDPATGTWTPTGSMTTPRGTHTATLLPNGKVLVCGGLSVVSLLGSAELYDPATGTWTPTGSMTTPRRSHTATLLPNGTVLVTGGFHDNSIASAEIYNPATGTWTATGSLTTWRAGHTATLLPNGKVLVCGGFDLSPRYVPKIVIVPPPFDPTAGYLSSAEVYDPATGRWTSTGSLPVRIDSHTATLLPNGKVLVCGGDTGDGVLTNAQLYDSATGTWTATGSLTAARSNHTATLLPNGKVLVAGGYEGATAPKGSSANAELYDPVTGTWSSTTSLATARANHTATLLPNGKVVVCAGVNSEFLASTEVYDVCNGAWSSTGSMATARIRHTATLLPNGKALVVGGENGTVHRLATAELYDPSTGAWSSTGSLATARTAHTTTLLPNGKVLVVGGEGDLGYLASTELYDPATGTWETKADLATARTRHAATLLRDGKVLVSGGYKGGSNPLTSAEIYDPSTDTWSSTGSMSARRCDHTSTLLPNGKVLVCGGGQSPNTAELYDPAIGTWSTAGNLARDHSYHTATLLPNGKILVCGGAQGGSGRSAELYDTTTGTWSTSGSMVTEHFYPSAALLPNGNLLLCGGVSTTGPSIGPSTSTELYDPTTGTWSASDSMATARYSHTATLLPNGKVLGTDGGTASAELYDIGLGFSPSWQPQITSASFNASRQLVLSGIRLRGISGGSGGNTQDSPTNYPVVQLRWLDSGQTSFLTASSASDTSFTSTAKANDRNGYALVTVYAGGIPSNGVVVFSSISTDAKLSSLSLNGATLDPTFDPAVTNYTVRVGNAVSSVSLSASTAFPGATLQQTPSNPARLAVGNNTFQIQVIAEDGVTVKTYTITVIRMNPDLDVVAGFYQALLVHDAPPSLGTTGLVTVTLKATGAFTGKAALGGVSIPFTGVLMPDGTAQFKPTLSTSFKLVDKTNLNRRLGSLAFSVNEADGVIGTLQSTDGPVLATFIGKIAPYSEISRVPAALLNQPSGQTPAKGVYTVVFPAKTQPPLDSSDYPQGDGFATLTLNANGDIRLAGYLADGTKYSAAAKLRADGTVPLFTQLYHKQGAMAGQLTFSDQDNSDVSGSHFIWLRPHQPEAPYYPAGWPHGMSLDVIGAKYAAPASFDFGQGSPNLVHGNATLTMSDGRLTSSIKKAIGLNPANGAVRLVSPTSTGNYSLTLSPRTGQFQGAFTHDGVSDTYRGILLNKGSNQGGFGYFLNSYPVWWGFSSEGGGVSLEPKDTTSSSNTSGSQGLTKTGPGTLVLGGTNNYNGSSINGGTLSFGETSVPPPGGNLLLGPGDTTTLPGLSGQGGGR